MKAKRVETWPFQILGGEAVIVVPRKREIHRLNEVATLLWQELEAERSVEELVDRVVEEFEIDAERAAADVRTFLDEMAKRDLVVVA